MLNAICGIVQCGTESESIIFLRSAKRLAERHCSSFMHGSPFSELFSEINYIALTLITEVVMYQEQSS